MGRCKTGMGLGVWVVKKRTLATEEGGVCNREGKDGPSDGVGYGSAILSGYACSSIAFTFMRVGTLPYGRMARSTTLVCGRSVPNASSRPRHLPFPLPCNLITLTTRKHLCHTQRPERVM